MSGRDFHVFPASMIENANDESAVLVNFGIASLGLSIAEARDMSLRLARAADAAELQVSRREKLRHERDDKQRYSRWDEEASLEAGKPLVGEL